jgi:16S rRNA G966 N2-methylase RsmD
MNLSAELLEFLKSRGVQQFIRENEYSDVSSLILNPPKLIRGVEKAVAEQIQSRRKGKSKHPDRFNLEGYLWPPPLSVEQSSSEKAAKYKSNLLKGKRLVDLTGGMGVDTVALSKHFEQTIYIEQDRWLYKIFDANQKVLETHIDVQNQSAEDFLTGHHEKACFFIDPARRNEQQKKVFRFQDCSPNLPALLPEILRKAEIILVKASPLIDIRQGLEELTSVKEVHVLSISNECKEVLFLIEPGFEGEPPISCVNITKDNQTEFVFSLKEEVELDIDYTDASNYLLIPNASILKAGAFKSITTEYPVQKIAPNTHLYTSEDAVSGFPGRQFQVVAHGSTKELLKLIPDRKANVITRNFPMSAQELSKKLGLVDTDEMCLIGFRDQYGKNKTKLTKPSIG